MNKGRRLLAFVFDGPQYSGVSGSTRLISGDWAWTARWS